MKTNFKQTSKVGVAGSFINQLMGNNSTVPEVGKGATQLFYSDRTCYEVVEVSEDKTMAKLEYLEAKADASKPLGMGHQNWILEPTGQFITVVWRRNKWCVKGSEVVFTKAFADAHKGRFLSQCLTPEQKEIIYADGSFYPTGVIDGITKKKDTYNEIKLLFGVKDYRYDWEF